MIRPLEGPPASPRALARSLAEGAGTGLDLGLFLDYDGSLVAIRPTPGEARANEELLGLLRGLVAAPRVRVAVASGRTLASLAEVLPPVPGLLRFGDHGATGRDATGEFSLVDPGRNAMPLPEPVLAALTGEAWPEGVRVERKSWSVAIHTRNAGDADRDAVGRRVRRLVAEDDATEILTGKELLEVRPRGLHKGLAVAWFKHRVLAPGHRVICLGDDRTDEDAFGALDPGDAAILVSPEPRATAAGHRLRSPGEAREFLHELLRIRRGEGGA